ncbi:MAG TPA: Rid family detoxifying hydrolase [Woeseiaceae bacterium]|nr:Rid family detoxifying hydrolase [Woeseiaceae bacterium]
MHRIPLLCTAALVAACADQATVAPVTPDVAFLKSPGTEDMNLPFSAAVRAGDFLFLSGAIGIEPESGELAPGGIQPETQQTLENIRASVERFGTSMDRVVKCTVFLADMAEWGAMNEVYRTFFTNPPARSALGTSGLALGARVEIECIAMMP